MNTRDEPPQQNPEQGADASYPGARSQVTTDSANKRWAAIKELFAAALVLEPASRRVFLESQCGNDEELLREVESLLESDEDAGGFLEQPVASVRTVAETQPQSLQFEDPLAGTRIGAYRLERQIGCGGMGAVYLATRADSEFYKQVAIKLIPRGKASDLAIGRFRNERQILAAIEHPYVARLLDGGTTEAGLPYFVMEYVEGLQLTEYCDAQSLTTQERLRLFLKVCSAVHYAHCRNVIHRDLKPSNILVQKDGTPKLLDFGIAKLLDAEIPGHNNEATVAGVRVLTPAYASPEQVRGEPVTVRSDVYSLGVILYELLCGERPKIGRLQKNLPSECPTDAHLSAHLRTIVFDAIRTDPEERYSSLELFAADIQRYLDGAPLKGSSRDAFEEDEGAARVSIAVLPFREMGGTDTRAFLASGIMDALIARLSRMERLSVRPTSAVLNYLQAKDATRASRELRVKYILEGSIHAVADQVRVSVQLVWAETGVAVWASRFDEEAKDLLKLEDSISEQVAYALIPQLTGKEREQLSESGTANGKAHEAYLRGRWRWGRSAGDQEELAKALVCFMAAIAEDANYARAHAGIADYYLRLGLWGGLPPSESFAAAIESSKTALRLDPTLAEAHASFAFATWAYHRDYATAEQHFQLAIMRNPDYASAHHWYGLLNSTRNRPELAIANLERARKIDPNSQIIAAAHGFVHYNARQYTQAMTVLLDSARTLKNAAPIQDVLSLVCLQLGEKENALEAARLAVELSGRDTAAICALAHAQEALGNIAAARELRDEIEKLAQQQYVSSYDRASAMLAAGEPDKALRFLQQSFHDRDWWISWIAVEPLWDPLRNEPEFVKLVTRLQPARVVEAAEAALTAAREKQRPKKTVAMVFVIAVLIAVIIAVVRWRAINRVPALSNLNFTKLTTNGTADLAAISPDGKYVAYSTNEPEGMGLWLRETARSAPVRLTPPLPGMITNLDFTRNGTTVSFVNFPTTQPFSRQLYEVPIAGGPPQQVLGVLSGPVGLSADGARAAGFRSNAALGRDELWVADTSTGVERILAKYPFPERFAWSSPPAWSPDNKLLACAVEGTDQSGFFVHLVTIDTESGEIHPLSPSRWQGVQHMSWLGSKSALAVVGQEIDSSFKQIWYVPYPKGNIRRIGNNLDDYVGVSATASGQELISVQNQTLSNVFVQRPGQPDAVQITSGSSRYFDLAWTPGGHLLYASDATGSADLWTMNADGTGERQLTSGPGRNYSPAASRDGKTIAFHSNRDGNWNIWRVDANGNRAVALTAGIRGGNWPQITPRSDYVVFHRADQTGLWNIWKVPMAGGLPIQLTKRMTTHPAVAAKDGRLAAWYSDTSTNPHWKLAIFPPDGGEPLRVFEPNVTLIPDSLLRWTPSGDGITFLGYRSNAYNIWVQPIDGSAAHPLTSFTEGEVYSFDWSRDGQLVYSRGMTTSDVVLIREASQK